MAGHWPEAMGLAAVLFVAAFLRLNDLSRAGWDPTRLAALTPAQPSLYDHAITLADPYGFTYW